MRHPSTKKALWFLQQHLSVVISLWQLFSLEIIAGKTEGWQTKYVRGGVDERATLGAKRGGGVLQDRESRKCKILCCNAIVCVCVSVPHKGLSKQTTRMSSYVPAIPLPFIG